MNKDEIRSIQSKKGFTSNYFNSDQGCARGKKVASTGVTITSTTTVVNTYTQALIQPVEQNAFITLPKYIRPLSVASKERKTKQASEV